MENNLNINGMIPYIVEKIASLLQFSDKEEWYAYDEDDEYLPGKRLDEFVSFVYNELTKNLRNEELLKRCFEVVEKLLEIGDEKVKNYIYFMFIESLTNQLGNDGYDENIVRPYMGPRSLRALDRINDFWMKGKIIESLD